MVGSSTSTYSSRLSLLGQSVQTSDNVLPLLPTISSKMKFPDVVDRVARLPNIDIQGRAASTEVSPFWGLFDEFAYKLPTRYRDQISQIVNLNSRGDLPQPEKTLIRLDPSDYFKINGRWVRAVKVKGVSEWLSLVKRQERRHIRLVGAGDIPFLVPHCDPAGVSKLFPFDVGEPFCGKRFRSVFNEVVLTMHGFTNDRAVLTPGGIGIYGDKELNFKGEPIAFSIWGVEHPDDARYTDHYHPQFMSATDRMFELPRTKPRERWAVFEAALQEVRSELGVVVAELRANHDLGLVHHEPQLDNHSWYEGSLTVLDWEEGAHRSHLTKGQFLHSIGLDLQKIIQFATCIDPYLYDFIYTKVFQGQPGLDEGMRFSSHNWLLDYFRPGEIDSQLAEQLFKLFPFEDDEGQKMGEFQRAVQPVIESVFGDGKFGAGVDWQDSATPFSSGFGSDAPVWQPEATTAFDLRLFLRRGIATYCDQGLSPSPAIEAAEKELHAGRFASALQRYERLANTTSLPADLKQYVHHNISALHLVFRADAEAETHFNLAYRSR